MDNFVITIARTFGSGGKEIALKLSERLGVPCYDRELLTMASERSGIDESVFVDAGEEMKGHFIANTLRTLPKAAPVEAHEPDFISDINIFRIQSDLIRSLASSESCIIVGKCADFILSDRPNVLSVFVDAPKEECIRSVCEKMHVTEGYAKTLIRKTNRYRAKYYNSYTYRAWIDPFNYDLILNSARMGRERCADMIAACMMSKCGRT
jgi:cytidylate kinase